MKRKMRSPKHSFVIRARPYQIQPIAIAPVWPGETMKMAMLQARCVTDPIKHPLIGWWHEYYVFYVKLNDLTGRDTIIAALMSPGSSMSSLATPAETFTYHNGKGVNWTRLCLERVVDEYFRDEGEGVFDPDKVLDGIPLASINQDSWLDSVKAESATSANNHELPGENPVIPDDVPAGFENHFAQWEAMRAMQLTSATFEDWLKSFGVKPPAKFDTEELYRPELLRYLREWQYPSNTVDPATGVPSSAVSWGVAESLTKARYFKEPGFIFAVQVTRPKVYFGRQYSAAAHMMQDAYSWLPAVLRDQPYTSLKEHSPTTGPLAHPTAAAGFGPTEDYWADVRDLAIHGDQFISCGAIGASDYASLVSLTGAFALPSAAMNKRYPTGAMIDTLFVTPASANAVRSDGVFMPSIASTIEDTSL